MSGRLFTLRFCPVKTESMNLGTLPFNPAWTLDVLFVNSNPIIRVGRPKFSQYNQKQTSNDKISLHVSIAATKLLKSTWPDGVMVAFQLFVVNVAYHFLFYFLWLKGTYSAGKWTYLFPYSYCQDFIIVGVSGKFDLLLSSNQCICNNCSVFSFLLLLLLIPQYIHRSLSHKFYHHILAHKHIPWWRRLIQFNRISVGTTIKGFCSKWKHVGGPSSACCQ